MSFKLIITILLLTFVGLCLAYLLASEAGWLKKDYDSGATSDPAPQRGEYVVAYYFHGTKRCPTCLEIEKSARQTIENTFQKELDDKRLSWKSINYDEPENEHYLQDFELVVSSLVIVRYADGGIQNWKNLERVWDLAWNQDELSFYVMKEVMDLLDEIKTAGQPG